MYTQYLLFLKNHERLKIVRLKTFLKRKSHARRGLKIFKRGQNVQQSPHLAEVEPVAENVRGEGRVERSRERSSVGDHNLLDHAQMIRRDP